MNIEEVTELLKSTAKKTWIQSKMAGVKNKMERKSLWVGVEREKLRDIMQLLVENTDDFPHFCVASASDMGETIEVNYHYTINFGTPLEEIQITIRVNVEKKDLWLPTLTDITPATIFSERELREMMGIEFDGLKDKRHLFLTDEFPEGVYPWRRDETAPKDLNKLYEGWKE